MAEEGAGILNRLLPRHPKSPRRGALHHSQRRLPVHSGTRPAGGSRLREDRAGSSHALHMPSHIFTRLGLWDDSIVSNTAAARSAVAQAQRLHGGGGAFDQLHAIDYLVYAYLQQAKDKSAENLVAELSAITKLDENQFAAAYAFAAAPARLALERHDWKAAAGLKIQPAWFPWNRFRNAEALRAVCKGGGGGARGDAAAARRSAEEIDAIRKALPVTRDYDWAGSIGAQWEAAKALIAFAEGKKEEGLRLLRNAADHEDAVDKHPVTPGALLPAREILADLAENGAAAEALRSSGRFSSSRPRRFNATAGPQRRPPNQGTQPRPAPTLLQLLEIARNAETSRPELLWARSDLAANDPRVRRVPSIQCADGAATVRDGNFRGLRRYTPAAVAISAFLTIRPADHELVAAAPVVARLRREGATEIQLLQLAHGAQVEEFLLPIRVGERPHRLGQQLLVQQPVAGLQVRREFVRR